MRRKKGTRTGIGTVGVQGHGHDNPAGQSECMHGILCGGGQHVGHHQGHDSPAGERQRCNQHEHEQHAVQLEHVFERGLQGRGQVERLREDPQHHGEGLGIHQNKGHRGGRGFHHCEQPARHGHPQAPHSLHGRQTRDHVREDRRVDQGRGPCAPAPLHLPHVLLPDARHPGLDERASGLGSQGRHAHGVPGHLQGALQEHRARRQRAQEDHQNIHQGHCAIGQTVADDALSP